MASKKPLWFSEQQGRSEKPQGLRILQLQKILQGLRQQGTELTSTIFDRPIMRFNVSPASVNLFGSVQAHASAGFSL